MAPLRQRSNESVRAHPQPRGYVRRHEQNSERHHGAGDAAKGGGRASKSETGRRFPWQFLGSRINALTHRSRDFLVDTRGTT